MLAGAHDTLQDDGHYLSFIGGTLNMLDVASAAKTGALYTLDETTGAAAEGAATNRSIGTLNVTSGASTPLGAVLAAGAYGDANFSALLSAPAPACN